MYIAKQNTRQTVTLNLMVNSLTQNRGKILIHMFINYRCLLNTTNFEMTLGFKLNIIRFLLNLN